MSINGTTHKKATNFKDMLNGIYKSDQSKNKPEKETQEILTLRNQIEARTIASVMKDEATLGLFRFLKQLKEQIEKQIRANDAKKLARSDNKSRAICCDHAEFIQLKRKILEVIIIGFV
ncbi:hypothetical protein HHI36_006499 [Cryptolaemus montrouzieri]|uniref:Uncharacterized protein n=1 Tax=Cryptolaemus montrouzieri TaxID=559131 RepID=A0ABD2NXB6_9CUCU